MQGLDPRSVSLVMLRRGIEPMLGLPERGLDARRDEVRSLVQAWMRQLGSNRVPQAWRAIPNPGLWISLR
eukprot:14340030-Alexandrium_andersonii.AAC.1